MKTRTKRSVNPSTPKAFGGRRSIIIMVALVIATLLGGCIIYTPPDPDGPDFYSPAIHYTQPPQPVRVEFVHSDIEWVLWEYYDWDYDVVYNLHYRYKYSDDEVALILFLAYYGHCQPIQIVQWRQSGIPWMTITTYNLRLQPDIFFVPVSPAYRFGPPYGNAYGRYWKNPKTVVLTDSEMVNLVYLKTTCLAYNASPVEVIKLREQGRDFNQIIWVHRSEGRHIKTTKGRDVREPPAKIKMRPVEHENDRNKPGHDRYKGKPIISGAEGKIEDNKESGSDKGKPGLRSGAGDITGGRDEQPKAGEKPKLEDKPKVDDKPKTDKNKPSKDKGKDKSKESDKPKSDGGNKGGKR
ncbi:MAG: hypothetical protein HZA49_02585 [Planctomycetes bacterium]|nr:hypothetical protein [Planctomycetota bacterium]